MKISIGNFKAIKSLKDFELQPFNIISGVNSSGKSSFIQFLLLLKQTIEDGQREALVLNGVVELGSLKDILCRVPQSPVSPPALSFQFTLSRDEFSQDGIEYLSLEECKLAVEFVFDPDVEDPEAIVNTFEVKYILPSDVKKELTFQLSKMPEIIEVNDYFSTVNSGAFHNDFYQIPLSQGEESMRGYVVFENFFPRVFTTEVENENYPDLDNNPRKEISIEPRLENIYSAITNFLKGVSYLGPLRESPRDSYLPPRNTRGIGAKGEFVAYVLEKEALNEVEYHAMATGSEGVVTYTAVKTKLVDAVNFWICDVFDLAKKIYAEEVREEYVVKVYNHFGVLTTIKHVGFGISQVLPIVVEGLRLPSGGTFILEQPEIHLHPRVQSLLFDFLYSLTLSGKRVVVETHSDHFIIRMRRRVAENSDRKFSEQFNLVFIEERQGEHLFRKLDLTELGSLSYFPKNFVEQQDNDYRAIVKAQAKRKTSEN